MASAAAAVHRAQYCVGQLQQKEQSNMAKGFARTKGFVRANEDGSANEGGSASRVGSGIGDADYFGRSCIM